MGVKDWKNVSGYRVAGVVDLGSSKTTCLIAAVGPWPQANKSVSERLRIAGVSQRRSSGIAGGIVTDLDKAEATVRQAIADAEQLAGVTLDDVVVSLNGAYLKSHNFVATADAGPGEVDDHDVARLFGAGQAYAERDGLNLVHLNTHHGYSLDGNDGIADPRGMAGKRLAANFHAVTAEAVPLQNLLVVIERCYLSTRGLLAGAYASAIAATTEEERRLGVTCIDFGGGKTALSVFQNGELIFTETIAAGGNHITFQIARELQTNLAEAERIKALYGAVVVAQSDQHEAFEYLGLGEDETERQQSTIAQLSDVICREFARQLGELKTRIEKVGMTPYMGEQIVVTGGAAELAGMQEFVARTLARRVRLGKPMHIDGLPALYRQPAFSGPIGLLAISADGIQTQAGLTAATAAAPKGYLRRVGSWLRQGF